jgi:hypothetical protein
MNQTLGTDKRKFLFLCRRAISAEAVVSIINNLIRFAGMTPAREPRIDLYPFLGRGGEGYTGFFPLMESYVVVDVYYDLGQTEILLSTCKPERLFPSALISFLSKEIGPTSFVGTL